MILYRALILRARPPNQTRKIAASLWSIFGDFEKRLVSPTKNSLKYPRSILTRFRNSSQLSFHTFSQPSPQTVAMMLLLCFLLYFIFFPVANNFPEAYQSLFPPPPPPPPPPPSFSVRFRGPVPPRSLCLFYLLFSYVVGLSC